MEGESNFLRTWATDDEFQCLHPSTSMNNEALTCQGQVFSSQEDIMETSGSSLIKLIKGMEEILPRSKLYFWHYVR